MKLGYARVSTEDQRLDLQRARLIEAGCGKLFEEKVSGAARQRPALEQLLRELRADDILVVTRLDRLARSPLPPGAPPASTAWRARPRSCCASPRSSLRKMLDCSRLGSPGQTRPRPQAAWC